jgi:polysaccharide export outer membrane protein
MQILFLTLLVLGAAVAPAGAAAETNPPAPAALTNTAGTNLPAPSSTNLLGQVLDDKYKLRVGDRISLQIAEDRDPARSLFVLDTGEVDVPYIGRLMATDKTCKQLAEEAKARLEQTYYYHATVTIALDIASRVLGKVYVLGQVRNQGAIDILVNENLTVAKAILRAGGFGEFANKKKVSLVRTPKEPRAEKVTITVNVAEILEEGKQENDVPVQPEDFIIVKSRLFNFGS